MDNEILDYFDEFEDRFDQHVKIVAVKYFYFESEARLYAARLKEAGIKSFLSNANTSTVIPLGEGGIGLHINEEQLPEATRIIKKLDIFNKRELTESDQNFRDADHEDIAYERDVQRQRAHKVDPTYMIITAFLVLIILLALVKASNNPGFFWG